MSRRAVFLLIAVGFAFVAGYALALWIIKPAGGSKPRKEVVGGAAEKSSPPGRLVGAPVIGQATFTTSTAPNGTVLVGGFQPVAPSMPAETGSASRPK